MVPPPGIEPSVLRLQGGSIASNASGAIGMIFIVSFPSRLICIKATRPFYPRILRIASISDDASKSGEAVFYRTPTRKLTKIQAEKQSKGRPIFE